MFKVVVMDSEVRPRPESIKQSDIHLDPPEIGGSVIVLQRHGKYQREDGPGVGSLLPDAARAAREQSHTAFASMLERIPSDERKNLGILIIGSETQYNGNVPGVQGGRRSLETAQEVLTGARQALVEHGLPDNSILNLHPEAVIHGDTNELGEKGPRPASQVTEPNMFLKAPDFVQYLRQEYPEGDFWKMFEADTVTREKRIEMGAEGPDQMADRMQNFVSVVARYAKRYHKNHPDSRFVAWIASHYDTISPLVKRDVIGGIPMGDFLGVDYGGGISIQIDSHGQATTKLGENTYPYPLSMKLQPLSE